MFQLDFAPFGDFIKAHAREQPDRVAISDAHGQLDWRTFDDRLDRIGAQLQADGVKKGHAVAIAGANAIGYALAYCAAIRIGAVAAPLTSSATPKAIAGMAADCGARHLFLDEVMGERLAGAPMEKNIRRIAFDDSAAGAAMSEWMAEENARPAPVDIKPDDAFNIIYSSGTTGAPKGVVQSCAMRMGHIRRGRIAGYDQTATTLISTPLYSNTTLVSFIPAIAGGGRVILMSKFEPRRFCDIAASEGATHAMLVPVQYQRIMALDDFDRFDLSSFRFKSCTSAPFSPALKKEVLSRWPGKLVDIYGMTEGGATCVLEADQFPDKLHTVGRPREGHEVRLIDEDGAEVAPGETGEIVGRSDMMMIGYHGLAAKTREAEWRDARGRRFIRHGDIGRFDEDGFLILTDRAKDVIISGGFNIYPSDLEAELVKQPAVAEAAVVGVPSEEWGETPVAFIVLRDSNAAIEAILESANSNIGKTQKIRAAYVIDEMPRSAIGKVLKRELRDRLTK
jgi:acyl-CoA synthetase (AMP-forming)/AMP-acid ligase II